MLSIIICARTSQISNELRDNIEKTIGFSYEVIVIDNTENKYSIFEAYNIGIGMSKGSYLCFIHDDIKFCSLGWGNKLVSIFQSNKKIGLVGIAGSKVKGNITSGWWDCPDKYHVINIIQHIKSETVEHWHVGWESTNLQEVVAIDGVFMAMSREENLYFSKKFNGFHNYDLDISFQTKKNGKKIVVTNEILLEHFSEGLVDDKWLSSTLKIHEHYKKLLPLQVDYNLSKKELEKIDFENLQKMIYLSMSYNNLHLTFKIWFDFFLKHPRNDFHNYFWREYIKLIYRCWR